MVVVWFGLHFEIDEVETKTIIFNEEDLEFIKEAIVELYRAQEEIQELRQQLQSAD